MTDSNLTQLTYVPESSWAVVPVTPTMRLIRMTGESLRFDFQSITSNEIRADRQRTDMVDVSATAAGAINFELSFGSHDEFLASTLMSSWVTLPYKDNAGAADSEVTGIVDSSDTIEIDAGGTLFKAGHLVRTSGFTAAANNGVFVVSSSTATTIVLAGSPVLVDDPAPAGAAKVRVVGVQGASADISSTSVGLASVVLDFTLMGLVPGQWIKIGGTVSSARFATAAVNSWARVVSVTTNLVTLDNRPVGWAADAGVGKGIRIFYGDVLRNGASRSSFTLEKGFLGQDVPNYLVYVGMMLGSVALNIAPGAIVTGNFTFVGKRVEASSTSSLDAAPLEAAHGEVLNAVADVGRIAEGGEIVVGPNYIQGFTISIANNLRERRAVGEFGLIGVGIGDLDVTGTLTTYFGDSDIYNKIVNNTSTTIAVQLGKNNQGYVLTLPRLKLMPGSPVAEGRNRDVVLDAKFQALRDPVLNTTVQFDRMEYFEE